MFKLGRSLSGVYCCGLSHGDRGGTGEAEGLPPFTLSKASNIAIPPPLFITAGDVQRLDGIPDVSHHLWPEPGRDAGELTRGSSETAP